MKKVTIFIVISILIIAISGHIYLQKHLLPNAIVNLEKYLLENTLCSFKIEQPKLVIFRVIFPKIEISYQKETILIYNLSIRPNLMALIDKQGEATGSGTIQAGKYSLDFNIIDSAYDIKTKNFLLSLETSEEPIEKLLNIASNIGKIELPSHLKGLEGLCKASLFLKSVPGKDVDLKANLYIKHLKLNLPTLELISSEVNADYMLNNQTPSLIVSVNDFDILDAKQNRSIIEKGGLTVETDLEKIEITDLKFTNNDIAWQGTADITNLKMHPTFNFNIVSELFHSVGEIRKISNAVNLKTSIYKDRAMLHINGHYDIDAQDLQLTGKGSTDIKTVFDYIDTPKNSYLDKIESNLKIEGFNLGYNIKNKILTADAYLVLSDTSYDKNIIAKSGSLDLKMTNKNIVIENFFLGDRASSIQAMGNFTIKDQIPFKLDIYIKNYEIEKLIQPFFDKDIGNALLSANSAIKGDLKDLGSILGACKWGFREGNLGRFKFLSQIASLINKPGLSEISFTQGKGSLNFQNLTLQSPESVLISDHVNLMLSGSMNTAGDLDLTLITEFPQEESEEESSSPLSKIGKILSLGVQEFFHKIKITGTIENPKYTLVPASINRLLQNLILN